jgi:hypothetical protein
MGEQNGNNNEGWDYNRKAASSSNQRTSKTSKLSQDTTKCQYERLSQTGKMEQGTK